MKINRLLPPSDPHRCTGRTTAIALQLLSTALRNQGGTARASDHHAPGTRSSAEELATTTRVLVGLLDLQHIEVKVAPTNTCGEYEVHVKSHIWVDV